MTTTDPITDADIARAAEALNETEDLWAKLASMADPTVACPECGGSGTLAGGGSLGEIPCPTCDGERVVEHPAADAIGKLAQPAFEPVRRRLLAMGQQMDARKRAEYVNGTEGRERGMSPIPTPDMPSKADLAAIELEIAKLREQGRDQAVKAIESARPGPRDRRAALPRGARGSLAGAIGSRDDSDEDTEY